MSGSTLAILFRHQVRQCFGIGPVRFTISQISDLYFIQSNRIMLLCFVAPSNSPSASPIVGSTHAESGKSTLSLVFREKIYLFQLLR